MTNIVDFSRLRTYSPKVGQSAVIQGAPRHVALRRGMWVMTADGVGILVRFNSVGDGIVDLVGGDGTTYATGRYVVVGGLRQARFNEIPECRRQKPEVMALFGYR